MNIKLQIAPYFLLWLLVSLPNIQATNRVFVKADAKEEYLIRRARDASQNKQSYQFMKGTYLPGDRLDPGMEEVSFESLVYDLAIQMRKKDFYPEPVPEKTDLLIVVHYGSTGWPDDYKWYDGFNYWNDPRYDFFDELGNQSRPRGLTDYSAVQLVNVEDRSFKAKLLGMDFGKTWSYDKRLLSNLSSEPRYFVFLCAYDFPALQAGEIKLQWITRYSIRAVGQSFADAIGHMNRIASEFMGENMKSFTQKRVDDSGFVSFGEIEVIDIEPIKEKDRETEFVIRDPNGFPEEVRSPKFD